MSDKFYDFLSTFQRWLCALGALYLGLSAIWGFPFADEINQSVVVVGTFLAAIIEASKSSWNKTHSISITDFSGENKEE